MKSHMYRLIHTFLILCLVAGNGFYILNQQTSAHKISALEDQILVLSSTLSRTTEALEASTTKQIATVLHALPSQPAKTQDELLRQSIAKASPSVASIIAQKKVVSSHASSGSNSNQTSASTETSWERTNSGTGFIVSSNGYIVTNKHVVKDPEALYWVILSDKSIHAVSVIYRDAATDIAIVKINGTGYTPVSLGNSSSLQVGQTISAIGNALGEYSNSVSVGVISGLDRATLSTSPAGEQELLTGVIQTDAAINPGNSGGPLVDLNGNVIGITVSTIGTSNSISFAIPINTVKGVIAPLIK